MYGGFALLDHSLLVAVNGDIPMNNHPVSGSTALNCQLKI